MPSIVANRPWLRPWIYAQRVLSAAVMMASSCCVQKAGQATSAALSWRSCGRRSTMPVHAASSALILALCQAAGITLPAHERAALAW
jgi:hypothetical protein